MTRPFHDLLAGYRAQEADILAAVQRVLESGQYILGREVASFETEFAAVLGVPHVVGVASATEALQVALLALDVRPGDEVCIPALTAAPTAMAVLAVGAVPVLVDVDLDTYTMDPASLAAALSSRTAVVVPVHLYGQCADLDALARVVHEGAEDATAAGVTRRPIAILEDAAQAHGATDQGRLAGSMGRLAAWSFYPTKNLGTFGDGGALSTADAALAARCRRLRMYGQVEGYDFAEPGLNARLDELHAAILRVRLTRLAANNATRRATAARYRREIKHPAVTLPAVRAGCEPVWHQFVVRAEKRDALAAHLASRGLQTLVHYARALSQMTALKGRAVVRQPPRRAEQAAAQVLSLPIYPEMQPGHQDEVIAAVNDWRG